jgi:uncharacterized protein YneF (UPF0154 family)
MSWDTIMAGLLILSCTGGGMILGAWIAARGFEKSMIAMIEESDSSQEKDEN